MPSLSRLRIDLAALADILLVVGFSEFLQRFVVRHTLRAHHAKFLATTSAKLDQPFRDILRATRKPPYGCIEQRSPQGPRDP